MNITHKTVEEIQAYFPDYEVSEEPEGHVLIKVPRSSTFSGCFMIGISLGLERFGFDLLRDAEAKKLFTIEIV